MTAGWPAAPPARPARVTSGARPAAPSLGLPALFSVAFCSLGGPVALAALYAPTGLGATVLSAPTVGVAGVLLFLVPLAVWLRYSRHVTGAAGLTGFVAAALGRRAALVQGSLWIASYLLYLLYTGAYVAYDVLPMVAPQLHPYRPVFAVGFPVAIAGVMVLGRRVTMAVLGLLTVGQLGVLGLLGGVGVAHGGGATARFPLTADTATGVAGVSLLFVCGSLPLFLGGEVRDASRSIRRVLPLAFLVAAVGVVASLVPYAADPAFARSAVPGQALVSADVGAVAGYAVGAGVAASVLGVMLVEYVALTRLGHALTGRRVSSVTRWLAVPLVLAGPVSLLNPDEFYDDLLKPSLVLLWLSQAIVVAGYPWFVRRRRRLRWTDVALAVVATGLLLYGLWTVVGGSAAT